MKQVRFGIVGAGVGANFALRAMKLLEEKEGIVKPVAVSDVVEDLAKKTAEEFGIKYFLNYRDLFVKERVDAVFISTPHYLHFPMAIDAIEAGVNVLVDKPMAINIREADEMIRRARRAGVKLGVNLQGRFDPSVLKVKEAVDTGRLGRLFYGEATVKWFRVREYYDKSPWRGRWATEGGGALINQAIHTLDQLIWIMGPVEYLWAQCGTVFHNIEVEDLAVATLRFKNGALGLVQASTALYPGFPTELELYGTNGTAIIEGEVIKLLDIKGEKPYSEKEAKVGLETWARPEAAPPLNHAASIRDFAQAVLEDREPKISGEEGRKSIEIINAIYQSSRSSEMVRLPLT
ncbi:MAG: Gfo/Idh/MocA family oxidoreductase [Thermoproteota archaeon]